MAVNSNEYLRAGVDIDAGDALVARVKPHLSEGAKILAARGAALLHGAGGFAAAVRPPPAKAPSLVVCADGVGTKASLLMQNDLPQTAGVDVVAMCVNDLICAGARPLLFLDYYACDSLSPDFAARVIDGVARGCALAGCALVGGETAEMPGVYAKGAFDLAGFAVGVAEEDALFRPRDIVPGDAVIAIDSSGPHSNGYSLIRRILRDAPPPPESVMQSLLAPTRIYCRAVAALRENAKVRGLAHITGGGITQNLPRILPPDAAAKIAPGVLPPAFQWIQDAGKIGDEEMLRVFNCGIGMAAVVAAEDAEAALASLRDSGETCRRIGEIVAGAPQVFAENFA